MPVTMSETPRRYAQHQQPRVTSHDPPPKIPNSRHYPPNYVNDECVNDVDGCHGDCRSNANNCNQPLDDLEFSEGEDDYHDVDSLYHNRRVTNVSGVGENHRVTAGSWHGVPSPPDMLDEQDLRRVASEPYFNDDSRKQLVNREESRREPVYSGEIHTCSPTAAIFYSAPDEDAGTQRLNHRLVAGPTVRRVENMSMSRRSGRDQRPIFDDEDLEEIDSYDVDMMQREDGEEELGRRDNEEDEEEEDDGDKDEEEYDESTSSFTSATTQNTSDDSYYDYDDSGSYSSGSTSGQSSDSSSTTVGHRRSSRRRSGLTRGALNRRPPRTLGRKFLSELQDLCHDYKVVPKNSRKNWNASAAITNSKQRVIRSRRVSTSTTNDDVDSDSDSGTSDSSSVTSSDRRRHVTKPKKRGIRRKNAVRGIKRRADGKPFLQDGIGGTGDGSHQNNANMSAARNDDDQRVDKRDRRKNRTVSTSTDEVRRWCDPCFRHHGRRLSDEAPDGQDGDGNAERGDRIREATLRNETKRQLEAAGAELNNTRMRIIKIVALALEDESGGYRIFDMSFRRLKSLDERASGGAAELAKDASMLSAVVAENDVTHQLSADGANKLLMRGSLGAGGEMTAQGQMNNNNVGDVEYAAASNLERYGSHEYRADVSSPKGTSVKLDAFMAAGDLFKSVTTTRLHGLDKKESTLVCEHFLKFGHFLFDLYQKNKCTDVTIQLTTHVDNKSVTSTLRAHSVVLAAHSTWFADQILNGGPWIVAEIIYLDDVCGGDTCPVLPATVNALVEYMYTGRLSIDTSNVVQLLVASEKLGMVDVVKKCCANIDSLPPDNVLMVIGAACDHGLTDVALLESKWQQIAASFTHIVRSRAFHQLGVEAVCRLLSRDDLMVASERDVVEACLKWISADRPGRLKHVRQVLGCVKFSRLHPDELVWLTNSENYLLTDQKIRDAILEANWLHTRINAKIATR